MEDQRSVVVPRALALLACLVGASSLAQSPAQQPGSVNTYYGAFSYSEPIAVPLFRGLEPSLRLAYSSAGGSGLAGVGWGLEGFSTIERAGPSRGTPRYDSSDVFLLDGQELVACVPGSPSPSCTTGGTHATRIESYQRLRYDAAANTWTVWNKDGTRRVYAPVYQAFRGGVFVGTYRWGLSSVVDTRGNTVSYGWWCDGSPVQECYPDSVSYNGTVVRFHREPRPDPVSYANGSSTLGLSRFRLRSVDVVTGGSRVRAYRLTYGVSAANGQSLLTSVQQLGRDATVDAAGTVTGGSALPPVTFSYDSAALSVAPVSAPPVGMWSRLWEGAEWGRGPNNDGGVRFGDFDGDGRQDMLWMMWECMGWYNGGCQAHRELWLNKQSGWVQGPTPPTGGYFALNDGGGHMEGGLRIADVNGDGKSDLVWSLWECTGWYGNGCQAHRETWLSTGSGWVAGAPPAGNGYFALNDGSGRGDGGLQLADVNGDGRADLVWSLWECTGWYGNGCQAHRETWLSTGSGWVAGPAPASNGYFTMNDGDGHGDGGLRLADVNGDGRSDLVWSLWECTGRYGPGCQAHRETWLSTGSGWVAGPAPASNGYFTMVDGDGYGDGGLRLADVNGDGRSDLVWSLWECTGRYGPGCQAHRETWLSTGSGWVAGPAPASNGYFTMVDGDGYGDGGLRLAEVNGDGRSDLVWSLWECTGRYGPGCQAHRETWLSTGSAWVQGAMPGTGGYFSMWDAGSEGPGGLDLVDLNGDGAEDLLWQLWQCTDWYSESCQGHREAARFTSGRNLLTSATSSLGGTTTVAYKPSSAWSNTYLPVGAVLQTVSSVQSCDGRGSCSQTRYSYEGGLWSSSERRFLGFRKVTSVLDAAGNYTETFYHQHVGCISKPEATYYRDAAGRLYQYSTFGYMESSAPPYTSLMTDRWEYECNQTGTCRRTLLQIGYDQYGNGYLTYEHGDFDVQGDERTSLRGLYPNTGAYIVALPAYENVYAGIGTGGALLRQSLHAYDGSSTYAAAPTVGLLTRQWGWNSQTGGYITRGFGYDARGNRTSETDPRGATTTIGYDGTYQVYETSRCNALGQCSYKAWHAGRDLVASETDLNGATTLYAHDALGRPLQTALPDGTRETFAYLDWGNPHLQRIRRTLSDGSAEGLWTEAYHDGLGREWRKVKKGGLVQDTQYNDGSTRVWRQSAWYGPGETPRYQVFAYDGLGRLRTVTNPDGSSAQRTYGNGLIATYDELGHERVVWTDAYGQMTQVREKNGAAYHHTTYRYDLLGNLTRVTNAAGHATTVTWDSLGRKLVGCDPDTGCTTYTYDDGGLMLSRRDSRGQTMTYTYDILSRPLTKTYPDGRQARWTYDEAGRGASRGALTTTVDPSGSESRSYDSAGRITSLTRCVSALCYTLRSSYDVAGRLASVTYPDGEVVPYTYDAAGRLVSVGGYVTRFDYNGRNQLTSAVFANGTTTTFSYSDTRQWLTEARVVGPEGTLYQAGYQYDLAGRVRSTTSTTHSLSNLSYTYDELSRLMGVTGAQTQSFAYDALGNMTWNSHLGSYAYAAPGQRHAVSAAGGQGYTYDATGNMLSGAGRTLEWDAEGRLVRVVTASGTTSFAYDADGQRVARSGPGGTTYTFGPRLEFGPNGLTKYYYAGPLLVARRDSTGAYWYHQDHLGSPRVVTNASGRRVSSHDYSAFGQPVGATAVANSRGYGGHVTDDTGLVYMNARYYDPRLGRFVSADTLVPSTENPQALNRYAFVYNNPISNTDPTGHAPVVAAVFTAVSVAVSTTATATVIAMATVGAATMAAGYVLKDPMLMSIGGVLLGAASGFTFGAGFLGAAGTVKAGWVGATVAALTSPVSPLSPKLKQTLGWAYTLQNLFHEFKHMEETVEKGADELRERLERTGRREEAISKMKSELKPEMQAPAEWNRTQKLYGKAGSRVLNGGLTEAQVVALDVAGGMVGPSKGFLKYVLDNMLGWIPGMRVHAVLHDFGGALGELGFRPGFNYLGQDWLGLGIGNKLSGQVEGIFITSGRSFTSLMQRAW